MARLIRNYGKTFIIAEAGVNHNGRIELAEALVDAAAAAGADAVKFQTFRPETLIDRSTKKARYQKETTAPDESQFDMLARLVLSDAAHRRLIERCKIRNIRFLSSAFSIEDVVYLDTLGLEIFKIPSGEITNLPYLRKIASLKKEIILSTGMADLQEVEAAMHALISSGANREGITLLHCTSAYPAPFSELNLRAMASLHDAFSTSVGYSDHTPGIEAAVAAVALGGVVVEKHLTLDRSMAGPDHRASLEPDRFAAMVKAIRNIEKALGDGNKQPVASEIDTRVLARKSIVASRPIRKGDCFSEENLTTRRPGTGISPMRWDELMGRRSERDYQTGEPI
jgi:N,N'-diacetyllegionaminate synthase